MALTIEKELEKDLEEFPQVAENATEFIQWYLREQIALEKWRQNRYSPETRALVKETMERAESSKETVSQEEGFRNIFRMLDRITPYLEKVPND